MRKIILIITTSLIFLFTMQVSIAQTEISPEIKDLQDRLQKVETTNNSLKTELKNLRTEMGKNTINIVTTRKDLADKISDNKNTTEKEIKKVENTISKNTLYWIIVALAIALFSVLLYVLLRKQLTKNNTDLSDNIQQTKKALEEEGIKLDSKLVDLLATQMQLMKEARQTSHQMTQDDHSLALRIANDVVRMEQNLKFMDSGIKGHMQLSEAIKRIRRENFSDPKKGYEIVDMLNKPYDEGMIIEADFIPDDNLKAGERIISRIIKPQVNYKGVKIQTAKVVVNQND